MLRSRVEAAQLPPQVGTSAAAGSAARVPPSWLWQASNGGGSGRQALRSVPLTAWSVLPCLSHLCLLAFTLAVVAKLSSWRDTSWWLVFTPLWMFHACVAKCTCSMPAPTTPYDRQWRPCHSAFALPLLLSFELLLCCYLAALDVAKSKDGVPLNLYTVFSPLLLLEVAVLVDNFRMCMILMPGEDDNMTDEALWETLPHFAVAVSMVFFLAATLFALLKIAGVDQFQDGIDWWTLLVDVCIGEFFAFLLCFNWVNPHHPSPPPLPAAAMAAASAATAASTTSAAAASEVSTRNQPNSVQQQQQSSASTSLEAPTATTPLLAGSSGASADVAVAISSTGTTGGSSSSNSAAAAGATAAGAARTAATAGQRREVEAAAAASATAGQRREVEAAAASASAGQRREVEAAAAAAGGGGSDSDSDVLEFEFQCGLAEWGGHFMKAGLVAFQVLLCMKLEGRPRWAANMSMWTLFFPLILVQLASLTSATALLLEGLLLCYAPDLGSRVSASMRDKDPFVFGTKGMRLVSWWRVEDEVRDERQSLLSEAYDGYDTFVHNVPPEFVKNMRKGELKHEVVRLQAALTEQVEAVKAQKQEFDRVQQEKILCQVCFEQNISRVLLPCRHRVLCSSCAEKCRRCPICRRSVTERMAVFDV